MRPGPNIAVRVEFMARHIPSQAGNVTHAVFVPLLSHFHLSIPISFHQDSSNKNQIHDAGACTHVQTTVHKIVLYLCPQPCPLSYVEELFFLRFAFFIPKYRPPISPMKAFSITLCRTAQTKNAKSGLRAFLPGRPFEPSFSPSSWPAPLQHDPVSPARRLTCGPVA